ncbi:DUF1289 domain-containing protein [Thalassotalea sp. LPB0316]|uniref:DUF1289 domain-containing protein n=1 Tax=Thalassotalea sp. LPB0316 TaxID=2769490 RepID=UPI0018671F0C|nr:DUF1289 domain-containing protein [Thalassotalea sp. LPB0316]QOL26855.1 DUF1289 domain-containing protein [Thalassotalea sp. LPB0316]
MSDLQLDFFDVPSPCVGICQSDEKGYCLGCMRTREERQSWINFNNDEKQKVIKRCQQRIKRKNGKPIKVKQEEVEQIKQPSLFDPVEKPKVLHDDSLDFGDFEL